MEPDLQIFALRNLPEIQRGDRIGEILADLNLIEPYDVVVVSQKLVSKAEGRVEPLDSGDPSAKRRLVLREANRVLREREQLIVTETTQGFVCANSGVDESNVDAGYATLLPVDSDRSARKIHDILGSRGVSPVGVIISDTFGRAWRHGVTDVAIGIAGVAAILDLRGSRDANGRELHATEICIADEIAGASELVRRKDARIGAAIVRGIDRAWFKRAPHDTISDCVVRPPQLDLFR